MRGNRSKQIVQPPHSPRQIGLCQNPSAAQPAQAVYFRQAVGHDELRTKMIRCARRVLANSLGTTTAMWDDQVDALAQRFLVVRYDHRGHGESTATKGPYTLELLGRDALAEQLERVR